jgi:hypothetical protein
MICSSYLSSPILSGVIPPPFAVVLVCSVRDVVGADGDVAAHIVLGSASRRDVSFVVANVR